MRRDCERAVITGQRFDVAAEAAEHDAEQIEGRYMVWLRLRNRPQPALRFLKIAGLERRQPALEMLVASVEWMRR